MNYISKPLMEMKEMVYKRPLIESEVLYIEEYGDGRYIAVIRIRGSHPCGYIWHPLFTDEEEYEDEYDIPCEIADVVHGGFTFLGNLIKYDQINNLDVSSLGPWAGWDYAHPGDAAFDMAGRYYTTEEVVEEGRNAIKAIDIYVQRLENLQKAMGYSNAINAITEGMDMDEYIKFTDDHFELPTADEIKKKGCIYCQGGKCLCFDNVYEDIVIDAFIKRGSLDLYFEDEKSRLCLREINRPILYCPICGRKL